jgi:putative heme iron utilization protein
MKCGRKTRDFKEMSDFDPATMARALTRKALFGTLATLDESGAPYASLVAVATAFDGAPILLISRLALHTRNLERDPRVSLMLAEAEAADPLACPRVSLVGQALRVMDEDVRRRYLARHPGAAGYADFTDFGFWRIAPAYGHLVAGFGRIVDVPAHDLLIDTASSADLAAAEAEAIVHLNADHADTLALYAVRLAGARPAEWQAAGLDPEGLDLVAGGRAARVTFPQFVHGPGPLRAVLKAMADTARAAP